MSQYNDDSIIPKLKTYVDPNKKRLGDNPTVTKAPIPTKVPGAQVKDATKNPNGYNGNTHTNTIPQKIKDRTGKK